MVRTKEYERLIQIGTMKQKDELEQIIKDNPDNNYRLDMQGHKMGYELYQTFPAPRRVEFYEIVDHLGHRYLHYMCHKCKKWHIIRSKKSGVPSATNLRLHYKKNDEIIMWCGNGNAPESLLKDNDGLTVTLFMTDRRDKPLSKKIKRRIEHLTDYAQSTGYMVKGTHEGRSLIQLLDQEDERIARKLISLTASQKQIQKHKLELAEMKL